jgi:hypothetical protein
MHTMQERENTGKSGEGEVSEDDTDAGGKFLAPAYNDYVAPNVVSGCMAPTLRGRDQSIAYINERYPWLSRVFGDDSLYKLARDILLQP